MTTHNNLRRLRRFLLLAQKEMADFGSCTRFMIQSIEVGRKKLSPRIASEISRKTGVDLAWLTDNDPTAPMIDLTGQPYTRETFERQKTNRRAPDASHYHWREMQLGVAFDLHHRLLGAWRLKGKEEVERFMDRVEKFIVSELDHHIALQDAVYGERRRASKAALKTGRLIALQFLTPFGPEPFRRGRERLGQAIAAFTARDKSKKRV